MDLDQRAHAVFDHCVSADTAVYPQDPREQLERFKLESENFMAQTGSSLVDLSEQASETAKEQAEVAKSNVTGTASALRGLDFNFDIQVILLSETGTRERVKTCLSRQRV